MTLIVLAVLATAWLGYFALWVRERRATRPLRNDSLLSFSQSLDALGSQTVLADSLVVGARSRGEFFEPPRTPRQALHRRRQVAAAIVSLAILSLLAVPVFGAGSLAVHVLADLALVVFAFGSVRRQPVADVSMADVRVLYPDRPAPGNEVLTPLRRVANG